MGTAGAGLRQVMQAGYSVAVCLQTPAYPEPLPSFPELRMPAVLAVVLTGSNDKMLPELMNHQCKRVSVSTKQSQMLWKNLQANIKSKQNKIPSD